MRFLRDYNLVYECWVNKFNVSKIFSSNVHFQELDRNFVTCVAFAVSCNRQTLYLPTTNQFCYWSHVLTAITERCLEMLIGWHLLIITARQLYRSVQMCYLRVLSVSQLPARMARQPLVSQGFHFVEASRWHSDAPHSIGLLRRTDWPDAETSVYLTKQNTHKRHTSMPPAGFKPRITANDWPQTHTPYTARPASQYGVIKIWNIIECLCVLLMNIHGIQNWYTYCSQKLQYYWCQLKRWPRDGSNVPQWEIAMFQSVPHSQSLYENVIYVIGGVNRPRATGHPGE